MHPSRRRKKRPNYGIKTVEVIRGTNGFGFTISGQQPCILSCIVANSPADQAGLRAGDFLISVNGVSVSKITHDAVVNLIGNSVGPIRMTIAENYYSDSSDEELEIGRMVSSRKPKYMHKPRGCRSHKSEGRSIACVDGKGALKPSAWLNDPNLSEDAACNTVQNNKSNAIPMEHEAGPVEYKALVGYLGTIEMPKHLLPNTHLQTVCSCIRRLRQEKRAPTAVLMTILPTCLTLKNAANHILAIYPTNRVVYISSTTDKESRYFGLVTSAASHKSEDNLQNRVAPNVADNLQKHHADYSLNIWQSEGEKKCNLDDKELEMETSNSCHVFVTDPKIIDHRIHVKKAESFNITCTNDSVTGNCLEFPKNALSIVSLVQNMYRLQDSSGQKLDENNAGEVLANSPQPSASSNSDSGIGFRDDCGNVSDRILVVEFPAHRPFPAINSNSKKLSPAEASKVPTERHNGILNNDAAHNSVLNNLRCKTYESNAEKSCNNLNNIRAYENVTIKNVIEKQENLNHNDYLAKQNNEPESNTQVESVKRLTVRAMPNTAHTKAPTRLSPGFEGFSERAVDVPEESPGKKSCESVSLNSMMDDFTDFKGSVDNVSVYSSKSMELSNGKNVFKTPSTKYLENRKSTKRQLKMIGSYDHLAPSKYEESVLHYKLSPKVYGVSKPNYSCEELNNLENVEMCAYGSLQDLCRWGEKKNGRRTIAQSEPDVRLQRSGQDNISVSLDLTFL